MNPRLTRTLFSFALGFVTGAALGALLVRLFVPVTGAELKRRLRAGWAETLEAARQASEARRAELERQLAEKRGVK